MSHAPTRCDRVSARRPGWRLRLAASDIGMRPAVRMLLALVLAAIAGVAGAHEVRPAYLELTQTADADFAVLWKVPGRGDNLRLGLYVELPANCENLSEPMVTVGDGSFAERWAVRCKGGLTGGSIRIAGLSATMTDALVRLEYLSGSTQVTRLQPSSPAFVVPAPADALGVARTYTVLGIEHILSGIDHLLFVLALLIITRGGWPLVKTVTAFTVSHSITLTLATLGYIHVPPAPVEAVIALSIVFVAAEIVHGRQGRIGLTARAPWIVALIFGLVHGLGFAGGLSQAGLPDGHIPTALLFFSIGVETGHLIFIGAVLLTIALLSQLRLRVPRWAPLLVPYAIGSVAMFWVIERVAAY